jgi:hypothetical protein
MGEQWYYADREEQRGPVSLQELKVTLAALPDAKQVLVWRESFSDWIRAGEVPELKAPPLLPAGARLSPQMPSWVVKWWWYPVALAFFGSIGSLAGRKAMAWVSGERKKAREIRRRQRRDVT